MPPTENSQAMLLGAVRDEERTARSARERFSASVEAYVRVQARAGSLVRALLLEQFSPDSPLAAQRDAAMAAFTTLITEAIARTGRTPPDSSWFTA